MKQIRVCSLTEDLLLLPDLLSCRWGLISSVVSAHLPSFPPSTVCQGSALPKVGLWDICTKNVWFQDDLRGPSSEDLFSSCFGCSLLSPAAGQNVGATPCTHAEETSLFLPLSTKQGAIGSAKAGGGAEVQPHVLVHTGGHARTHTHTLV